MEKVGVPETCLVATATPQTPAASPRTMLSLATYIGLPIGLQSAANVGQDVAECRPRLANVGAAPARRWLHGAAPILNLVDP